ncbi:hypothetical protein [Parapedobacter sp. 10938]|uniref:hypothetical protein n=1 Tax=Parapedobacter flavus TaxID=3110225 RepID=UPI002DBF9EE8|nr:hypothetical protein [Parapedobacter sp. 10938]MEC3880698.1 hypothetical protein [Parapedobacter sp. 10938]
MNTAILRYLVLLPIALSLSLFFTACQFTGGGTITGGSAQPPSVEMADDSVAADDEGSPSERQPAVDDEAAYEAKLLALANGDTTGNWPVANQPLPLPGAILPYKRIIAFYGNLYSRRMGILGELAPGDMLAKLDEEVANWNAADTTTAAIPALHYIAVTAQGSAGRDGKYRSRMPFSQIDSVLRIAERRDALVFLDIQVGFSTLEAELPRLDTFLRMPHVHLGIDPEFSMKDDLPPGKRIGHFTAADINFAATHLAELVRTDNLPPKVLVVHRFTQGMVKDYDQIKLRPEVQLLIHMDGWGAPALKKDTYRRYVANEPVQFTGFKFFYKNDLKPAPHRMMTLAEVLALTPKPIYIQYQ